MSFACRIHSGHDLRLEGESPVREPLIPGHGASQNDGYARARTKILL
jgi:hypothetical protein